jgi:hypothetical protein
MRTPETVRHARATPDAFALARFSGGPTIINDASKASDAFNPNPKSDFDL